MTKKDRIKKEINSCINNAKPLSDFLQGKNTEKDYSFHNEYQKWYTAAIKIVEFLAPDRYQEFKSYYEIDSKRKVLGYGTYVIQDYLKGVAPSKMNYSNFDTKSEALQNFYNQFTILNSIFYRIDGVLSDLETELLSELQDLELSTASELIKVNIRSSGVICGVILENYLHKITQKHKLNLSKKNPTLSDYNELLKNNNLYDITVWRKISYLGDIRNLCAHKKEKEPTKEQVEELIEGVNWVTKNVF